MPRCSICFNKNREKIDIALTSGSSERSVAKQYGVNASSVHRHKADGHICKTIQAAQDAKVIEIGKSVNEHISEIYKTAFELVAMAKAKNDPKAAAYCLSQAISVTNLLHESNGMEKLQEEIEALKEMLKNE